jgi:hypothetical protein
MGWTGVDRFGGKMGWTDGVDRWVTDRVDRWGGQTGRTDRDGQMGCTDGGDR